MAAELTDKKHDGNEEKNVKGLVHEGSYQVEVG